MLQINLIVDISFENKQLFRSSLKQSHKSRCDERPEQDDGQGRRGGGRSQASRGRKGEAGSDAGARSWKEGEASEDRDGKGEGEAEDQR